MKNSLLLYTLLLLFSFACRKNSSSFDVEIIREEPEVFVASSFQGLVVDENDNPLASAQVRVANEAMLTDAQGFSKLRR